MILQDRPRKSGPLFVNIQNHHLEGPLVSERHQLGQAAILLHLLEMKTPVPLFLPLAPVVMYHQVVAHTLDEVVEVLSGATGKVGLTGAQHHQADRL